MGCFLCGGECVFKNCNRPDHYTIRPLCKLHNTSLQLQLHKGFHPPFADWHHQASGGILLLLRKPMHSTHRRVSKNTEHSDHHPNQSNLYSI